MFDLTDIVVRRDARTILEIDQLKIPTEKMTVILGHNGSGKSTLVNILAGLLKPDQGSVKLNSENLFELSEKEWARRVAFLPQKLPSSSGLTCRELVRLGRFPWRGLFSRWNEEDEDAIKRAMHATQTEQFADSFVDALSGGERQRVWIAMLLAQSSPVMILDEPTSALDVKHQYGVLALLSQLNKKSGIGIITIIHDINLALRYATHVVALKHGKVLFQGDACLLRDENLLRSLYETPVKLLDLPESNQDDSARTIAVVCA